MLLFFNKVYFKKCLIFLKRRKKKEKPKNLKLIALCLAFEVANADNDIDTEKEI